MSEAYFGTVVNAISVASGLCPEMTAVTATLLGGIGGRCAGINDIAGNVVPAGINLIVSGRDAPRYRRALDLLLAPVDECQQGLREVSAGVDRKRAEGIEVAPGQADRTNAALDRDASDDFAAGLSERQQRLQALRQPTVMLRNPDPDHFRQALGEVADGAPLILYPDGDFLGHCMGRKEWSPHLAAVVSAISGSDQTCLQTGLPLGYGKTQRVHASLLVTCSTEELKQAVASKDTGIQQLLRRCVITDVPGEHVLPRLTLRQVRDGYTFYRESVREILTARRKGEGLQFAPDEAAVMTIHTYIGELRKWLDGLPPDLLPYFAIALALPYKVHWTLRALLARGERREWIVPATIHVTRWMLLRQRALLSSFIAGGVIDEHQQARIKMLAKLAGGPCLFRDLLRKYSVQRRDLHQPILNELLDESLVQLRSDGLLELTPEGLKAA